MVLDDSFSIHCTSPGRGCDLSAAAQEATQQMVNQLVTHLITPPSGVLGVCSDTNCSTLGPAQVAWCHVHYEMCRDAMVAAVRAREPHKGSCAMGRWMAVNRMPSVTLTGWRSWLPSTIFRQMQHLLGVAHEMDGTGENGWNGDESKIDLHNNFFGARIGETMLMGVAAGQVSRGELPVDLRMYMISFAGRSGPSDCPSCLYVGGAG